MWHYRLPKASKKGDFIWNIFGSCTTSGVSVLLLMLVSHILGEADAGIFTLAYSTAQMLYYIGTFEVRNVQVTDIDGEFAFSDILMNRIITVTLMMLAAIGFVILKGFTGVKAWAIILLTVYMVFLSMSEAFQGNMQLKGYLNLGAQSQGFEVLLAAIAFGVVLIFTKSLLWAIVALALMLLVWIIFFDIPYNLNFDTLKLRFDSVRQKKLFLATLPLFLSMFMNQYTLNAPKYAINALLDDVAQSHYGYLFMPAFVINLLSLFILRPQIVSLSDKWHREGTRAFIKGLVPFYVWVLICTIAVMLGGWFLGIPLLNLLYGTNLTGCEMCLMVLLLGGAFSAGTSVTIVLLTVIRKQRYSLIAYVAAFGVSLFLPNLFVARWGLMGACLSYLSEMILLFVLLLIIFLLCLRKAAKDRNAEIGQAYPT